MKIKRPEALDWNCRDMYNGAVVSIFSFLADLPQVRSWSCVALEPWPAIRCSSSPDRRCSSPDVRATRVRGLDGGYGRHQRSAGRAFLD
jgi:hypothetical protein